MYLYTRITVYCLLFGSCFKKKKNIQFDPVKNNFKMYILNCEKQKIQTNKKYFLQESKKNNDLKCRGKR